MILPKYEEVINDTRSELVRKIIFDKVFVRIYGSAKYGRTEIKFFINPGCRRRNVDLSRYISAINDYFVSHPFYGEDKGKVVKLTDFSCVKFLYFIGLKFSSNEFQLINDSYPNIMFVDTIRCTIYKEALIGCLKCNYYDYCSDIISLDSFDGISSEVISLDNSNIINMNKRVLHFNNICTKFSDVDIDYEKFFLTTVAPNMRKLEINRRPYLRDNDLLFISGFYNLESVDIGAFVSSYKQFEKLEKLREIAHIYCVDEESLAKLELKSQGEKFYQELLHKNVGDDVLRGHFMAKRLSIQNNYQDFLHKIYVPQLERVKWENKISINDLERIKEELISISTMSSSMRKKISVDEKESTFFDQLHGLDFDRNAYKDNDDVVLVNSGSLFDDDGIDYYVKSKKIIL